MSGVVSPIGHEGNLMLVLVRKECGAPVLEKSPVWGICAIPINRAPFPYYTCLEEIIDVTELYLSEDLGI